MNLVVLSGNLTADPEIRHTTSGTSVCEFTIAHNKRWRTESGEQKEKVSFIGCVIWGKRGERFAEYHRKGSKALVRGELTQESWEDKKTAERKSRTRVNVEEWEFCEGKRDAAPRPQPAPSRVAPDTTGTDAQEDGEGSVPF